MQEQMACLWVTLKTKQTPERLSNLTKDTKRDPKRRQAQLGSLPGLGTSHEAFRPLPALQKEKQICLLSPSFSGYVPDTVQGSGLREDKRHNVLPTKGFQPCLELTGGEESPSGLSLCAKGQWGVIGLSEKGTESSKSIGLAGRRRHYPKKAGVRSTQACLNIHQPFIEHLLYTGSVLDAGDR